ncbi:MAG: PD40 domain-containing protein, partial [Clostridia bacterium]|nr:PD40 domain-containing protein [Clostridia bacterium]
MKKIVKILSLVLVLTMVCGAVVIFAAGEGVTLSPGDDAEQVMTYEAGSKKTDVIARIYEETPYYIVVRHKQLGASHYAYTEALAEDLGSDNKDPEGREAIFNPGSELVLVSIVKDGDNYQTYESVLLKSKQGVIRDPDVSPDGTKVLFSWKQSSVDDYHLYEMTLADRELKQLTFGSGAADIEPKYLSDGSILFNSTRDIQVVDCWKTPVSNLYKCNADGSEILRLGYDQVHTTYPTVTSDGRVVYTRWDYNDRTQMWIQGVFQMFEDGTNQTELYGNNSDFPTSLLHTREVPGSAGLYVSIASGHHVYQHGKLVWIDTSTGRNG